MSDDTRRDLRHEASAEFVALLSRKWATVLRLADDARQACGGHEFIDIRHLQLAVGQQPVPFFYCNRRPL